MKERSCLQFGHENEVIITIHLQLVHTKPLTTCKTDKQDGGKNDQSQLVNVVSLVYYTHGKEQGNTKMMFAAIVYTLHYVCRQHTQ